MTRTIAFDAHMIGTGETGNETYAASLAGALARLGGYAYRLYTPHPAALDPALRRAPGVSVRAFRDVPAALRIPVLYPRFVQADRAHLLHLQYVAPPCCPCPVVLTVHDVSFRRYPAFFSPWVRWVVAPLIGPSLRRAARVLTLSECSKRDIIRFYGIPAARVAVTPGAAGPQFASQSPAEIARVRTAYALPTRYILAVGNVQPRKNLARLAEAFAALAAGDPVVALILVGPSTWQGSAVEATVRRLGLERRVRFKGYVPACDLPALYSGALAFCYPSLYEGFGLPPLEAMACGAPVVVSNTSSLPEVVGDAALSVAPTSVSALAAALDRFLTDPAARATYRARGLARAALFSWERTARLTRAVYDAVLGVRRAAG